MADFTTTTNLNLKKPAIGGSSDKWGEYLNSDLDTIDTEIQSLKTASTSRSLESLSNVLDTTPTTGQLLQYDTASWKAATVTIPDGIEDLGNVTVSSPADGQVLAYSASNSRWENQTPGAATIPDGTITTAKLSTSLQGQVNLILQTTGTPTDDQILRYNASTTNWEFQDLPGGTISALSDTDVSAISNQDVLVYNSTSGDWVSRPLAIADVTGLQASLDAKLESSDLSVSSLTDTTITTTADNSFLVYDASDSRWKNEGPSTARTSLGLGTLATQSTITESQISDLGSYITASSIDTLTNKSGNISQWTNDSGYLTAETNDLGSAVTGTLPIANGGTSATTASAARIALLPTLGTAGQVLAVNTGTTDVEWVDAAAGGGSGTVTSVAISGTDGIEVDSGSPITTSGTINLGINATTLSSHLSLGTAATTAATDYATAAQGALANSAVQPGDNLNTLGSGSELAGKVVRSDGSGGAAWYNLTVDLPTEVASTLQVANGGTGVTSLGSLDAADLGSGAATDGYVLTADGAGGAAWEAASGGGASLPIDLLSSGASIRKSDGTTAVLSESGGAVTLENVTNAYLSGGVYLGGTGAANYLDDYEEGTWTPVLAFGGASAGVTYNARRVGVYNKVGRLVTINCFLAPTNVGSSTGTCTITGLPFQAAASGQASTGGLMINGVTNDGNTVAIVDTNAIIVDFYTTATNGTRRNLTKSDVSNNDEFAFTVTYFTT